MNLDLLKKHPNKYNLTIAKIKKLVIVDWDKLKTLTWHNPAMKRTGSWWCHLEGCQTSGRIDDEDEFWIGFREEDNKIDCHFSSYGGMCGYTFKTFYNMAEIENDLDFNVQVNAIAWLNKMIDDKILALPD